MERNNLLINLKDIHFSYPGPRKVFEGLNFQLRDGERVGLIGPNGSGKTTLFQIIMGLIKPSSGVVELFGQPMKDEKDFRRMRLKIGLLFQDPDDQLFSPTVLEDVAFGPLNQGKSVEEAKGIARETLDSLGLKGFEDRVTHKLSGGEKRLVSLATVLAMRPRVLLLDEPTTGLDMETTERLVDILNGLELSYIFISHDMDFILQTTDRVYGMVKGKIVSEEEAVPHTHYHVHGFGRLPHSHSKAQGIPLGEAGHNESDNAGVANGGGEPGMKRTIKMRQMEKNQKGTVRKVSASGDMGRRIREMGLVPGVEIQIQGRAPLKDPVAVKIKDYVLTLRNDEASFIFVEVDD